MANVAKSLDLLRQNLQQKLNSEIDTIIQKYVSVSIDGINLFCAIFNTLNLIIIVFQLWHIFCFNVSSAIII